MKRRLSPAIVGAFVLGAAVLAVAALLSFGAGRLFREPYRFAVFINDASVSGLEAGSPVKLSGVRLGRVESVTASYDRTLEKIVVRVVCDFDAKAAHSLLGGTAHSSEAVMRDLVIDGLHAKLNFNGITGSLYMDLTIQKNAGDTPGEVEYEKGSGYPIVPMAPSGLAEFTEALSSIANGFAHIDYAGLSTELRTVLVNVNHALAGVELKQTATRIEAAAGAVETLLAGPELRTAIGTLDDSMQQLQQLIATWREASPGLRDDAAAAFDAATTALAQMQQTATAATALLQSRRDFPDELVTTLQRLQRAADAIQQLADTLERNPGALLRGREAATPTKK